MKPRKMTTEERFRAAVSDAVDGAPDKSTAIQNLASVVKKDAVLFRFVAEPSLPMLLQSYVEEAYRRRNADLRRIAQVDPKPTAVKGKANTPAVSRVFGERNYTALAVSMLDYMVENRPLRYLTGPELIDAADRQRKQGITMLANARWYELIASKIGDKRADTLTERELRALRRKADEELRAA